MAPRIVFVVKVDVGPEQSAAHPVMPQFAMHQRLTKRYDQMGGDGCDDVDRNIRK